MLKIERIRRINKLLSATKHSEALECVDYYRITYDESIKDSFVTTWDNDFYTLSKLPSTHITSIFNYLKKSYDL